MLRSHFLKNKANEKNSTNLEEEIMKGKNPAADMSASYFKRYSSSEIKILIYLSVLRILGAVLTCPNDCDETFNYWEPLHYLMYGSGQQTWEYAPQYALRSYLFLMPSLLLGKILMFLMKFSKYRTFKPLIWYGIRCFWAVICSFSETRLFISIKSRFGSRLGYIFLLFGASSPGMFVAAPALLPSSVSMIFINLILSYWIKSNWTASVFLSSICIFATGWPFVGIILLPFGIHCLYVLGKKSLNTIVFGILCVAFVSIISIWIDSYFYGKWIWSSYNIVRYNVFSGGDGKGDELYGIEPWTYYTKNLILNTSLSCILAIFLPILGVCMSVLNLKRFKNVWNAIGFVSPAYIWLILMFSKKHKEERFLYPIYPFLFLGAAMTLEKFLQFLENSGNRKAGFPQENKFLRKLPSFVLFGTSALTVSSGIFRGAAIVLYYSSYCQVFNNAFRSEFENISSRRLERLCMREDWHRFPSSFFLPDQMVISYLDGAHSGQLPQSFADTHGTAAIPAQPFNDMNQAELSRYTTFEKCKYIVMPVSDMEMFLKEHGKRGRIVYEMDNIDSSKSRVFSRAYFLPFLSKKGIHLGKLVLWKQF